MTTGHSGNEAATGLLYICAYLLSKIGKRPGRLPGFFPFFYLKIFVNF